LTTMSFIARSGLAAGGQLRPGNLPRP